METSAIIERIRQLPLDDKFKVVEETLKSIKKEETTHYLSVAAEALYNDYVSDKELTAFTQIDFEHFYEAR